MKEDTEKGADRVEKEEVEEEDVEVDVEDTQIRVESAFQSTPDENRREEEEEYFCQHISTTNEHANGATRSIHVYTSARAIRTIPFQPPPPGQNPKLSTGRHLIPPYHPSSLPILRQKRGT